jgi:heme A synthase
MKFGQIVKDSLTEGDGETFDPIRVLGMLLVVVFIVLSVLSWVFNRPFDMVAYGTGAGLTISALGMAVKITDKPKKGESDAPQP